MSKTLKSVLHISTECYPVAKEGGMADVVGSLPIYQKELGWSPSVVIPRYRLKWFEQNTFRKVHSGSFYMEGNPVLFDVYKANQTELAFELYCIDIPGRFDRNSIYLAPNGHGFLDEPERNVSFQRSVLQWLRDSKLQVDIIHCHDHQVGFIPFMMKKVAEFEALKSIPVVYTIHNGAYNSRYPWYKRDLLPEFPGFNNHFIDWSGNIDSVSSAVRLADHVNTVSPNYLEELKWSLDALKYMIDKHPERFSGILNGIDSNEWDPKKDSMLAATFQNSWDQFKKANKNEVIGGLYQVDSIPLISFIGRFAHQKGADLLAPAIERILAKFGFVNFYILGSGDKYIEHKVNELRARFSERVACYIGYNEALAHKIYAASDFIIMPSRFEPCGLNQMFAMRYGTLPIARKTGGLKDTVVDFMEGGTGIAFDYDSIDDLVHAMARALQLYKDTKSFKKVRSLAVKQDYSWTKSAEIYLNIYNSLLN